MKKILVVIAALLVGLFVLVGCKTDDKNAGNSKSSTDSQTTETREPDEMLAPEYSTDNMDVFLEEWVMPKLNPDGDQVNGNEGEPFTIFIPVLQSSEYVLARVEVRQNDYIFYYHPSDPSKLIDPSGRNFEPLVGISVTVSKHDDTFNSTIDAAGLTPVDGIAYDSEYNRWYIDQSGRRVRINFPETIQLTDASELSDYFTFEEYGSSSNGDLATE